MQNNFHTAHAAWQRHMPVTVSHDRLFRMAKQNKKIAGNIPLPAILVKNI
ncbi:hypothetical protein [Sphingobacterium allocomposti]|nr:hypothetical protein [Sphingobacterium composti Yoo et al. 2007 non Ten et al. 2007]